MTNQELDDLLLSIGNRCDLARFIISTPTGYSYTIPTLLEDNFEDMQEIMDRYCVVRGV